MSTQARAQRAQRTPIAQSAPIAVAPPPAPVAVAAVAADAPVVEAAPARPARKPFGSHVQKLSYPAREGFHRHWFKDTPGRIDRALEAGYAHVKGTDGKNVATGGGVSESGGKQTLYLMEIPLEWYREDQALKDAQRDEIDAKLRRGVIAGTAPGQDGAYLPTNKAGTVGPDVKMHGR